MVAPSAFMPVPGPMGFQLPFLYSPYFNVPVQEGMKERTQLGTNQNNSIVIEDDHLMPAPYFFPPFVSAVMREW